MIFLKILIAVCAIVGAWELLLPLIDWLRWVWCNR